MKAKKQVYNPYLPSYEYIPDGEPHVFGNRIYLYGSHDRFNGADFCLNDYVCYSAEVMDLTDWKYEGVIFRREQDPSNQNIPAGTPENAPGFSAKKKYEASDLNPAGIHAMFAPDVVQGPDQRFYLYYCLDWLPMISVAVCDTPAGKYEFLGYVTYPDGTVLGKKEGDYIQFDPGVFLDEDGQVYLYSGNAPMYPQQEDGTKHSQVMRLENDMLTLAENPRNLLPSVTEGEGTGYEGHEFFEASSIRKINGKYYFVYSSVNSHELCYAVSDRPDQGYIYGGTIVDIGDIYLNGRTREQAVNYLGNTHGGIECVNGQWYVFYHRQTNQTQYSRQGCAEKIFFNEDGSISQVEITSCGLNPSALTGKGTYPAYICCHLQSKDGVTESHPGYVRVQDPYLTQELPDIDPESPLAQEENIHPAQYVANLRDGASVGYKYFEIQNVREITLRIRGMYDGNIAVKIRAGERDAGIDPETDGKSDDEVSPEIAVRPDDEMDGATEKELCIQQLVCCGRQNVSIDSEKEWQTLKIPVQIPSGIYALYFVLEGTGYLDLQEFSL